MEETCKNLLPDNTPELAAKALEQIVVEKHPNHKLLFAYIHGYEEDILKTCVILTTPNPDEFFFVVYHLKLEEGNTFGVVFVGETRRVQLIKDLEWIYKWCTEPPPKMTWKARIDSALSVVVIKKPTQEEIENLKTIITCEYL